jgi:hypothetical protein
VYVQVLHALPAVAAQIGYQPKTIRAVLRPELGCDVQQVTESFLVGVVSVFKRMTRYHQQVNRRLRLDIGESNTRLILIDERDRDFAACNFAKDGFRHNNLSVMKLKSGAHHAPKNGLQSRSLACIPMMGAYLVFRAI